MNPTVKKRDEIYLWSLLDWKSMQCSGLLECLSSHGRWNYVRYTQIRWREPVRCGCGRTLPRSPTWRTILQDPTLHPSGDMPIPSLFLVTKWTGLLIGYTQPAWEMLVRWLSLGSWIGGGSYGRVNNHAKARRNETNNGGFSETQSNQRPNAYSPWVHFGRVAGKRASFCWV